jgi:hypothetical protein
MGRRSIWSVKDGRTTGTAMVENRIANTTQRYGTGNATLREIEKMRFTWYDKDLGIAQDLASSSEWIFLWRVCPSS